MTNLDSILKSNDITLPTKNKGLYSQGYGFSSDHVWMCIKSCVKKPETRELMLVNCGVEDS